MSKAAVYLEALEKPNFWRMFVDGKKQRSTLAKSVVEKFEVNHGHLAWATREPEGLHMMRETAKWLCSADVINAPITFELINEIHIRAFPLKPNLYLGRSFVVPEDIERHFNDTKKTEAQIAWIKGKAEFIQSKCTAAGVPFELSSDGSIHAIWFKREIDKYVPILLKNYEAKVQGILDTKGNREDLVTSILNLAQNLELIHIFGDGNLRVVTLILNKELMRFGFDPVILQEPNDLDQATFDEMQHMLIDGQAAYNQFMTNGYPYRDCVAEDKIAGNITKIPKLDLLGRSHEMGGKAAQSGVLYTNQALYSLLRHDLVVQDGLSAITFQRELNRNKNNFDEICALWDEKFLENKALLASNTELYNSIDEYQRLSSQYFKYYLKSKGIALNSRTVDYHKELKKFFTAIGKILIEYKTCHDASLRNAEFCHLTDTEMQVKLAELEELKVTKVLEDASSAAAGSDDHNVAVTSITEQQEMSCAGMTTTDPDAVV